MMHLSPPSYTSQLQRAAGSGFCFGSDKKTIGLKKTRGLVHAINSTCANSQPARIVMQRRMGWCRPHSPHVWGRGRRQSHLVLPTTSHHLCLSTQTVFLNPHSDHESLTFNPILSEKKVIPPLFTGSSYSAAIAFHVSSSATSANTVWSCDQ